ncbi:MAG: T9SS type A sorting domain-containing protein [Flavobacteriaceae bacterium]|nr:T9SS type A sorting domain-containing protein [Flavobacteriaceae bacterium]
MKLILLTFLFFWCSFSYGQNTLGVLDNTTESLDGYTLFSPRTNQSPRYTYLINNCGEIINQWESAFSLFSTDYLMEDGSLFRSVVDNQSTLDIPGNTGRIEHLDWDGNLIWALTFSDTDFSFHHDYVVLPNGNILMLVAYRMSEAEAIAEGRDPTTIANAELYEERVLEIQPVGTNSYNLIWEWHSWDHLIQDFDNTKNNFGVVADNPQLVDINFGTSFGEADWWHSNALSYSVALDQIIISNRNLNEFIIIDHSTTTAEAATSTGGNSNMGGNIIYRWGNPASYGQGTGSDQVFFGQHDVQFIPDGLPNAGKIMIFNNGNGSDRTRIQIITAPYDSNTNTYTYSGGAYGPVGPDYEYVDPVDPTNFHATFLSGVQQLSNGNLLICHGPNGELFEVDSANNTVWKYQSPVGNSGILNDGVDPLTQQTRVFRALRYAPDYPGFVGKDLTPGTVIELNPNEDNCTLLGIDEYDLNLTIDIYPTLVEDLININSFQYEVKQLYIQDLNGRAILEFNYPESTIDLSFLKSGLYFVSLHIDNKVITKKIIKQ